MWAWLYIDGWQGATPTPEWPLPSNPQLKLFGLTLALHTVAKFTMQRATIHGIEQLCAAYRVPKYIDSNQGCHFTGHEVQ